MTDDPRDVEATEAALRRLEERLDRASAAAERLIAEAAVRLVEPTNEPRPDEATERRVPPSGWQRAGESDSRARRGAGPISGLLGDGEAGELLVAIAGALRDRLPVELQQRLLDAVREVLLALRALIDWYLERSERRRRTPVEVTDIPIL